MTRIIWIFLFLFITTTCGVKGPPLPPIDSAPPKIEAKKETKKAKKKTEKPVEKDLEPTK